jgi:hypothetical protein
MKTPKIVHIRNGKRNFIRYTGKPRMVIEVYAFNNADELIAAAVKLEKELGQMKMPYLGAQTEWNGKQHLLVATQFTDEFPTAKIQKDADELARKMRYIADWYRYQVLKADQN